jgi:hypothetical protein
MHISEEGYVAGSVHRAELAAAYAAATDDEVKANLAAAGAENGMYVEDGELVDPSAVVPEPAPEPEAEADVEVEGDSGYEAMTKEELQDLLRERGLPTSGNKPELIDRLLEGDTAPEVEPEPGPEPVEE